MEYLEVRRHVQACGFRSCPLAARVFPHVRAPAHRCTHVCNESFACVESFLRPERNLLSSPVKRAITLPRHLLLTEPRPHLISLGSVAMLAR